MKSVIFLIVTNSPAWEALKRIDFNLTPGTVVPVDKSELESFSKDFQIIEFEMDELTQTLNPSQ